ncbi:MAG: hypothetical protein A3I07_02675 [Candidatus Doudnabacteria bacterium RIFCSPLOWO2_02_FULL_42_9]|uniref:Type 4 fimbrial biogenesis protein PilX N-terminal domain-containing protein n=1 Tax=Candidatus Doudnabacteria bacterium RIFCSPHIGHO2_01_FULL_41_86 TaxID=1817821 RepID=A0A1F5N9F8_9BACT|nr:MAG: hypothetical protein A2717_02205 [Candidatus Doudnabacteria bacterium RIFCSPHIGHO2_01_FULL_41_86]OGE75574.1 MAG: hypothetical protein A3K07_01960 [Candidatus Doudnabacteria bacterium RIFCSPHIGHO2_01_43_10]OGE85370.1 MAG: hypothetical protein A3E28_01775 [Candidatus Doudnabacteria bacterium RIFCSPHIGHO2_12_FULL_42_22]OGE86908.1 MAG: hypothetical protein A3C49_02610 [Candidatus Doudnabacteria bacterium RIFCSPHIGHO2_02_FULL_42_25]OGE92507.1 MAG: hypothetical protein A2895_02765 [Candidatus
MKQVTHNQQQGQILLFALVILVIVTSMVTALVNYAGVQIKAHRQAVNRTVALEIAEAGAEMAIWKLNNQIGYIGETDAPYASGTYTIAITGISATTKLITVDSYIPNAASPIAHRKIQVTATTGTTNVGFNYGVQAGEGGIKMDNNSTINGNVFSNGDIIGDNNNIRITGTAIVAGAYKIDEVKGAGLSGIGVNAIAKVIEDSKVAGNVESFHLLRSSAGGDVKTTLLSNCTANIGGDAIYDVNAGCIVDGLETTPNPDEYVELPSEPLPVSAAQIDDWESDATAGGTLVGNQTIEVDTSLGPKKIVGDLILTNNVTLTMTGTIWVTGNITLNNGTTLRLAAGYGPQSGVILAGLDGDATVGLIDAQNGAQIQGSGTAGSYLMLLSQRNNVIDPAINVANNAVGAIFYAGTGVINVVNNASGKELTGYKLHLNQNTTITYEAGLASTQFGSSSSGGWGIQAQSWQLLQ